MRFSRPGYWLTTGLLLLILLCFVLRTEAQDTTQRRLELPDFPVIYGGTGSTIRSRVSVGVSGYAGSFLTSSPKAEFVRDSYTSFMEVSVQFQTIGSRRWQEIHGYPRWGLSYLRGNTGAREYIGSLNAFSGFIHFPVLRRARYSMGLRASAGIGLVDRAYDPVRNSRNLLIGTRLNAFLNFVWVNELQLTSRLWLNAGLSMMHLSNGGTTLPNAGLNTPGVTAGIRYAINREKPEYLPVLISSFSPCWTSRVQLSMAVAMASRVGGNHYGIPVLQLETGRRIAPSHFFGGGVMLVYNRSFTYFPREQPGLPDNRHRIQAGVYANYEHILGRLSFPIQVGVYAYNKNLSPVVFQQYGARWQFNERLNAVIMLKSHAGAAEYIHYGLGYKF